MKARELRAVLFVLLSVGCLVSAGEAYAQGRLVAEELVRGDAAGGGAVVINQPALLSEALRQDLLVNRIDRHLKGYRVRVYRGLGRNARTQSVEIADKLKAQYPNMGVYRSYQAPYYLTTVGNCRTRIDALFLRHRLLKSYPQAFVIEDNIENPPLCAELDAELRADEEQNVEGVQ